MKTDKLLHLVVGYAITLTIGLWSPIAGLITGIVAAAAKELIWDWWLRRGTPELFDALSTVIGSTAAFILLIAVSSQNLLF